MPDEGKESLRYNIADNINERFYQLPKGLFLYPRYRDLDPSAKIMYAILRDRLHLSKVNQWVDENGDIYLVYSQEKLADLMGFSQSAVSKNMKKLVDAGLLEKSKTGTFATQRIYINKLIVPDPSEIIEDVSEANLTVNDNREILEASLQKLKEEEAQQKEQKIKDKEQKVNIFPQEYSEVQKRTFNYSCRNTTKPLENTGLFPQEYSEVQKRTSNYSCRNTGLFPQEYSNIPTGISSYSSRNTNDTDILNNTYNNKTEYSDKEIHTHKSGSAAEQPEVVSKDQKIDAGTPQFASLIDLVKSELYSATVPMPAYAIKDISEAVSLYPMDMIYKAIEKTKKFHKHSFAYTLRILNSWQEEINAGNAEPWNFKNNKFSPSEEDNALGIDLDEMDRKQVFPWNQ